MSDDDELASLGRALGTLAPPPRLRQAIRNRVAATPQAGPRTAPWWALAAAAILAAVVYVALTPMKSADAPALLVTPNPIDFGDVRWSEDVEREVVIENRSSRPVTLRDPSFDCSCFTLAVPPLVLRLEAGHNVTIRIALRSRLAKLGPLEKSMILRSDDPVAPRLDVPIRAHVLPLEPPR